MSFVTLTPRTEMEVLFAAGFGWEDVAARCIRLNGVMGFKAAKYIRDKAHDAWRLWLKQQARAA